MKKLPGVLFIGVLSLMVSSAAHAVKVSKISRVLTSQSVVGDGAAAAHIDLIIGPRGSAAETAFALTFVAPTATNLAGSGSNFLFVLSVLPSDTDGEAESETSNAENRFAAAVLTAQTAAATACIQDSIDDGTIPAIEAQDVFGMLKVTPASHAAGKVKMSAKAMDTEIAHYQQFMYAACKKAIGTAVSG